MEEKEAKLIDLLRSVPADARLIYERDEFHSQAIPVGALCAKAAAALNAQAGVVEALEELYMAAVNVDLMGEFRERFPRKRAALRAALDKIKPLLPEPPKETPEYVRPDLRGYGEGTEP